MKTFYTIIISFLGSFMFSQTCSPGIAISSLTPTAATQTYCRNSVVTFTVTASGPATLTYQWYSNTTNNTTTGTAIPGATSATYTTPPLTSTSMVYYYVVVGSTSCSSKATSASRGVRVLDGTVNSPQTVCKGSAPSLLYFTNNNCYTSRQWQVSTDNINFTDIAGATAVSYQPPVLYQDTFYRVVATEQFGGAVYASPSTKITVTNCSEANNDSYVGNQGTAFTTGSILVNDKVNSVINPAISDVSITVPYAPSTLPAGITYNASNATFNVAANTAPGNYLIRYNLCTVGTFPACNDAYANIIINEVKDTDGDGVLDNVDQDDDNDGILDIDENNNCNTPTPLLLETFGTGTTKNSTPYTNYSFTSGVPSDGSYYVGNSSAGNFATWVVQGDHTGDTNGKMMVVNASNLPGEFYRRAVTIPYVPTVLTVEYYILNLMKTTSGGILPKVKVQVQDLSGNVIAEAGMSAGVPTDEVWHKVSTTFTLNNEQAVQIVLINDAPGGGGNDLAIDDIKVSANTCDYDGDGIPNSLDIDSDNDGCPDAMEGGENVDRPQVGRNGRIVTDAAGVLNSGGIASVDTVGVPLFVNSGGVGDTATPTAGTQGQPIGASQNATVNQCICYNDANTANAGIPVKHGITLLKRAGTENPIGGSAWPMNRYSAHTALESNTKGYVITRVPTTAALGSITAPVEGMMVYDGEAKCIKIYVVDSTDTSNTGWKCFNKPTCPNVYW